MAYVSSSIGSARVLLETTAASPSEDQSRREAVLPGGDAVENAYDQLKAVIVNIANDLGTALHEQAGTGLSQVQVQIALTFSGEADVWVVKASGEGSITATLQWDLGQTTS